MSLYQLTFLNCQLEHLLGYKLLYTHELISSSIFLSHPKVTALVFTSLEDEFDVSPTFPTLTLPSLQNNQSSLDLFGILLKLIVSGTIFAIFDILGFKNLNFIFCVFVYCQTYIL